MNYAADQFTKPAARAFELMLEYSYAYPKNFFGEPKINVRHSLLVRDLAGYLQRQLGGDLIVVEVATLFHDLGKISTVEGHEALIVRLLTKHKKDLGLSGSQFDLLTKVCSETGNMGSVIEYQILHNADNLAFLYDFQYQEAFYRYVGTKTQLFEKRMDPKHKSLNLPPAVNLGQAFYTNAKEYWDRRPEDAEKRYRPDIEGKDLLSYNEKM
ncbi:HD domain-containing protein [Candidatus Woesebacteria bacterium]|nr:HD domain-containing protein [Candidatus Woesebacteria bacterium]